MSAAAEDAVGVAEEEDGARTCDLAGDCRILGEGEHGAGEQAKRGERRLVVLERLTLAKLRRDRDAETQRYTTHSGPSKRPRLFRKNLTITWNCKGDLRVIVMRGRNASGCG